MTFRFDELKTEPLELAEIEEAYRGFNERLDEASDAAGCLAVVREWDDFRRRTSTWGALAHIRFSQDTRDDDRKQARDQFDQTSPKLSEYSLDLTRRLLESPHRAGLEKELGEHVFALWECAVLTYDPKIEEETIEESKLTSRYEELLGSAEIEFRGEKYNLSTLGKFNEDPDRTVRHEAQAVRWKWFGDNGAELDQVFDDLVRLRTDMAKTLGFDSYTDLAYRLMSRTDYAQEDVARYREAVREHVVPLGHEIRKQQGTRLGLERLMFWDEAVQDTDGNPAPVGDHDEMVALGQRMFDEIGYGMDEFFRMLVDSKLTDLEGRKGKAVGGYCSDLASHGLPFIFANFNGTKGDVEVFTHEMGHAFQCYKSRDAFPMDLWWPTSEAAEIHSMGLEFLCWPQMELFFGEDAERFRRVHLIESLLFLPYGVAVDHFQHEVYANPTATPDERHAMWREVEQLYLPWRDYGDLERPAAGAFWQRQPHIYKYPFYYIDYTLALACALQFWVRAEQDRDATMNAYVALCERGGRAPFQELARSAGLRSPFESGCLEEVVSQSSRALGL